MSSGTAVSASVKLWIVSASSATEPVKSTTISCTTAVAARMVERDPRGADALVGGEHRGVGRAEMLVPVFMGRLAAVVRRSALSGLMGTGRW